MKNNILVSSGHHIEWIAQKYIVIVVFLDNNIPLSCKVCDFHSVCCTVHCVSKKNIPDVFSYNLRKHCRIFIIFGRNITNKAGN